MNTTQLVFVIHYHLPIDQRESVFEQAAQQCYVPMLEALKRHPTIRLGLHYSGILFEWMENQRSDLIEKIADLVSLGQVELMGSGFYEPILPALPQPDAVGQIEMMSGYIEKRFGPRPQGIWLAEQAWEPELIELFAQAQIRYTLLGQNQFRRAGLTTAPLDGYYNADRVFDTLAVFPMHTDLAGLLPQTGVAQLMDNLYQSTPAPPRAIVLALDGHKLGLHPGSHEKVIQAGWLEEFFQSIEDDNRFECVSPLAYLNRFPPLARVYLPSSCSEQMLARCLPTDFINQTDHLRQSTQDALGQLGNLLLLGTGNWQSCLAKYSEANHLYRKMLLVSSKLSDVSLEKPRRRDILDQAKYALYRSQSHDAYWHGPSGGLHLPLLREAVYRQLIRAETLLDNLTQADGEDWISYDERDVDADMNEEVIVENAWFNVIIDPAKGGVITEMDYKPSGINPCNGLTRRPESYHRATRDEPVDRQAETPLDNDLGVDANAQDETSAADGQIDIKKIRIDQHPRRCFMDRFPASTSVLEDFQHAVYLEQGDFLNTRYHVETAGIDESEDCDFEIMLNRAGRLQKGSQTVPLHLEKKIRIPADRAKISVSYKLKNPGDEPIDLVFCPELNLALHSDDDSRCVFELDRGLGLGPSLKTSGEIEETAWLALADLNQHLRIWLQWDPPATIWRYPVETVTQTDSGIESIFQATAVVPKWELTIPAKQDVSINIVLEFRSLEEEDDAVVPISEDNPITTK